MIDVKSRFDFSGIAFGQKLRFKISAGVHCDDVLQCRSIRKARFRQGLVKPSERDQLSIRQYEPGDFQAFGEPNERKIVISADWHKAQSEADESSFPNDVRQRPEEQLLLSPPRTATRRTKIADPHVSP